MLLEYATPIDTLQEWNDPSVWLERPKSAMPVWVNALPIGERMPEHVILRGIAADSTYHDGIHVAEQNFVIQYDYDGFPSTSYTSMLHHIRALPC